MLPLVDRPQLAYTFEHLRRYGVTRAIVSCGYLPTQIQEHFGDAYGELRLEYRVEEEPLGTGGAIRFAARGDRRAVLRAQRRFAPRDRPRRARRLPPRAAGAARRSCSRPSRIRAATGSCACNGDGRVLSFLEKPRPEEIDTNLINAGLYVLEPDVLDLIPPGRPVSIEREVFPQLVEEEAVCRRRARPATGSTSAHPRPISQAHRDVLERNFVTELGDGARLRLHARLAGRGGEPGRAPRAARLRRRGSVDRGRRPHREPRRDRSRSAVIGEGASIESSVIGAGAVVGSGTHVSGSIVGERAELGAGLRGPRPLGRRPWREGR